MPIRRGPESYWPRWAGNRGPGSWRASGTKSTRTGNILRAAERRPATEYGLDAVVIWPHLWLTMPDTSRQELTVDQRRSARREPLRRITR